MVSMEFYSKAAMERAMKVQEVILRAVVTENSVRAENAVVRSIREILVVSR